MKIPNDLKRKVHCEAYIRIDQNVREDGDIAQSRRRSAIFWLDLIPSVLKNRKAVSEGQLKAS